MVKKQNQKEPRDVEKESEMVSANERNQVSAATSRCKKHLWKVDSVKSIKIQIKLQ